MGKRRPTKRVGAQAAAQGPKRARPGSLSPVADGFLPAATGRARGSGITPEKTLVAKHEADVQAQNEAAEAASDATALSMGDDIPSHGTGAAAAAAEDELVPQQVQQGAQMPS